MKGFSIDTQNWAIYDASYGDEVVEFRVVRFRNGGSASDMNVVVLSTHPTYEEAHDRLEDIYDAFLMEESAKEEENEDYRTDLRIKN